MALIESVWPFYDLRVVFPLLSAVPERVTFRSIKQPIAEPACGNCSIDNLEPSDFLQFVAQVRFPKTPPNQDRLSAGCFCTVKQALWVL